MRRNCSVMNALTGDQQQELLRWCTREGGPWAEDISTYPGPPVNASAAAGGRSSLAESGLAPGEEPYRPQLSGYDCEIFRNEYLAWCAVVELPAGHPDAAKKPAELSKLVKVHGGISISVALQETRRLQFDCNHGFTDLVPYACFARAAEHDKRVGALPPPPPADGGPAGGGKAGGKGGGLQLPGRSAGLGGKGGGALLLPQASADGAGPAVRGGATYKDYRFVRKELEGLAAQLRAREEE